MTGAVRSGSNTSETGANHRDARPAQLRIRIRRVRRQRLANEPLYELVEKKKRVPEGILDFCSLAHCANASSVQPLVETNKQWE